MQDQILRFAELCAMAHETGKVCRVCGLPIMSDESYHGDAHGYRHLDRCDSKDIPVIFTPLRRFWSKVCSKRKAKKVGAK